MKNSPAKAKGRPISPARVAAFEILLKIERETAFSSVLLPAYEAKLSDADKRLCHQIVLGTLRSQIYLDRLFQTRLKAKKLDLEVKIAIRIALFQIIFLEKIPTHSAINDSVNLTGKYGKSSAKGLVNAVLRKLATKMPQLEPADEIDQISIETSHPRPLVERWIKGFGIEFTRELARANNDAPPLTFRVTKPESFTTFDGYDQTDVEGCFVAERFDDELRKAADGGAIFFQDEASQLVGNLIELLSDEKYLDVCASPGGKFSQVAARFRQNQTIAGDLTERRIKNLKNICGLLDVGSKDIVQYDAENGLPFGDKTFEKVFVDAPCSGTGTIRHNPEIRYTVSDEEINRLTSKQLQILKNASKLVKGGGTLYYSTCSLETEENEEVCKRFLAETDFEKATIKSVEDRYLTGDGFLRTFPGRDGLDGFFFAAFIRNEK